MFHFYIKINNTSYSIGEVFIGPQWIEDKVISFRNINNHEIVFTVKLNKPLVKKDLDNPDNFIHFVLDKLSNNLSQGTIELFSSDKDSINLEEYAIEGEITIIKINNHLIQLSIKPNSLEFVLNKY